MLELVFVLCGVKEGWFDMSTLKNVTRHTQPL
jgi:hypothetical protein